MPENATIKTVEHGDVTPLPEAGWLWRRLYVFVVTALLCIHIGFTTWYRTSDINTLREVIRNDQFLIMLFALLYLAGASAEAITRLFAALRTTRKETVTTAPPPATLTTSAEGATKVETPPTTDAGELPPDQRVQR